MPIFILLYAQVPQSVSVIFRKILVCHKWAQVREKPIDKQSSPDVLNLATQLQLASLSKLELYSSSYISSQSCPKLAGLLENFFELFITVLIHILGIILT